MINWFRRITLEKQVANHCKKIGWDDVAAQDAASNAVEIVGSNEPANEKDLLEILKEVCCGN